MNAAPGELGRLSSKSIAERSSTRMRMILGFEGIVWAGAEMVTVTGIAAASSKMHRAFLIN
jgi:hypothetical protein